VQAFDMKDKYIELITSGQQPIIHYQQVFVFYNIRQSIKIYRYIYFILYYSIRDE